MGDSEFREGLVALGITPGAFARLAGAGERVGQRWASGAAPVPPGAAALLRLALANARRASWGELAALLRAEAAALEALPARGQAAP